MRNRMHTLSYVSHIFQCCDHEFLMLQTLYFDISTERPMRNFPIGRPGTRKKLGHLSQLWQTLDSDKPEFQTPAAPPAV
jgi:hypothetical protein